MSSTPRQSGIRCFCRWTARLGIGCLNGGLLLLALFLAAVIGSLTLFQSLPVPEWIIREAESRLAKTGVHIEYSSLSSSLRGEIVLENLRVREAHSGQVILRCRRAVAQFDVFGKVFFGDPLILESLQIEDAALFGPPEISPLIDRPIARIIALDIETRSQYLEVARLLGEVESARLSLQGSIPLNLILDRPDPVEAVERPWRIQWIELAKFLEDIRLLAVRAPGTSFDITLLPESEAEEKLALSAQASAPRIELPGGLIAREVIFSLPRIDPGDRTVRSATARIGSIERHPSTHEWEPVLRSIDLDLRGDLEEIAGWKLPDWAELHARGVFPRLPETSVTLGVSPASLTENPQGIVRAQMAGIHLQSSIKWDRSSENILLDYELTGSPDRLLAHPPLEAGLVAEILSFQQPARIAGSGRFRSLEDFSADFILQARQFRTVENHYDEVSGHIHLNPQRLVASPLEAYDDHGQWARGAFIQNLQNKRFRILARGAIFPRRLDSLLPPFYRDLWDDIDPGNHPSDGDVDVVGIWGEPGRVATWVTAWGENLGWRGQPVDTFFMRLWQATGFVELFDLQVDSEGGSLTGSIGMVFPEDRETHPTRTHLHLDSHIALPRLAGAFGGEVETIPEFVQTDKPPSVRIDGTLQFFQGETIDRAITVMAESEGPVTAFGLPLDWLKTTAHANMDSLTLAPLHFGIATGSGSAEVQVQEFADQRRIIDLSGSITNAEYTTLHHQFRQLFSDEDIENPWESLAASRRGKLDLSLKSRGELGRWDSFSGDGTVSLTRAPLGQIDLFGGLSRLFSTIGLGFTSFRIEDFHSDLVLTPGSIGFPNLEVRGPSLKIESQGLVAIPSTQLNFDAKLFFLDAENPSIRSLFGMILRPFGHVLEVSVSGNISDPVWAFRHNPLNLMRQTPESPPTTSFTPPAPLREVPDIPPTEPEETSETPSPIPDPTKALQQQESSNTPESPVNGPQANDPITHPAD